MFIYLFSGRGIDVTKIILEELIGLLPVGFGIGSAIFYYLERRYKQLMLVGVVVAVVLGLPLTVAGIVSAVSHPRCKGLLITGIVLPIVGIPLVVVKHWNGNGTNHKGKSIIRTR